MASYTLRVVKYLENEIGDTSWHKDLLQKTTGSPKVRATQSIS
ncbi:MAG: hypothetical protein V3S41_07450 [Spirochaetia bacterium]